ncbi:peroxiredoxin family protein [Diaphorobacter caeni]|uniref:peroxiredoxin family protein n=1 Tax=Diaphorobacter caeni TaxID=2784387 RepID=UPI00188F3730|nr:TlpA disulfide reductase family protein [Diaphorobacter caeni]MBF5005327.1 TlpA family protein disulfide reductase [Diaphorobacter caeni]
MRKQKQSQTHIYLGLLVFVVCWILSSAAHAWQPEVGEKPNPMEQLEMVNGQPVNLASYAGKPLVIYFGADWCAPCVANGRPAVIDAFNKYRNKGLQVLFVDLDDPFKLRGKKINESRELGIPIAMRAAPTGDQAKLRNFDFGGFGRIQVVPTAILLDGSGKVVAKIEQGTKLRDELDGAVAPLVR